MLCSLARFRQPLLTTACSRGHIPFTSELVLTQARHSRSLSLNPLKWFRRSTVPIKDDVITSAEDKTPKIGNENQCSYSEDRANKFIPVTRGTLLNALVMDKTMLSVSEKVLIQDFAAALDSYYSRKFYGIMEESKLLYDNLDPDKDTFQTRKLSRKELLDQEYWLLEKVEQLLERANYYEVPRYLFADLLKEHDSDGLTVSVNPDEYDLLKIWTRGTEIKKRTIWERLRSYLDLKFDRRKDPSIAGSQYTVYTRVFVAVRARGTDKLHLKVFKEVPCNKLEHLLPNGKIKMSTFDKRFLASSVIAGGLLVSARSVSLLSDFHVEWTYIGLALTGVIGGRAWIGYKNKRNQYLASLASTLYYRTIANNRGVLTLLTDRAQDEEFKEALLAYAFLLSPRNRRGVPGTVHTAEPPVQDTPDSLQARIEEWLSKLFHLETVHFDIEDALFKLDKLGLLLKQSNDKLSVKGLEESIGILPRPREEWMAVSELRDSQSSDELVGYETGSRKVAKHGWR